MGYAPPDPGPLKIGDEWKPSLLTRVAFTMLFVLLGGAMVAGFGALVYIEWTLAWGAGLFLALLMVAILLLGLAFWLEDHRAAP